MAHEEFSLNSSLKLTLLNKEIQASHHFHKNGSFNVSSKEKGTEHQENYEKLREMIQKSKIFPKNWRGE